MGEEFVNIKQKQGLSLGASGFQDLRKGNDIYVDKTKQLLKLVTNRVYKNSFLSRPRRFGKSLMISTLEAMFKGQKELFRGLAAEAWVTEQAKAPSPVLRFTLSNMTRSPERLETALVDQIRNFARDNNITLDSNILESVFSEFLQKLFEKSGLVVVLIDEYDAPILHNIQNPDQAEAMRDVLQSFYVTLKDYGQYLRFLMLTGISKFSKMSIFSGINNLQDISMMPEFGDIVGFTQEELKVYYGSWLDDFAGELETDRDGVLLKLKKYYDGFCFNGKDHVYNPWSVLHCLNEKQFRAYWYESSTPTAVVQFIKRFGMEKPNLYEGKIVNSNFVGSREIERATPDSFLYQSGYLTIKNFERRELGDQLTLGIPNREVQIALARTWLDDIYCLDDSYTVCNELLGALQSGDLDKIIEIYNKAILAIPYDVINRTNSHDDLHTSFSPSEAFFQGVFIALLWSVSMVLGEVQSGSGRSDIVVRLQNPKEHSNECVYVFELKLAEDEASIQDKLNEAMKQIHEKHYTEPYCKPGYKVTAVAMSIDRKNKQATYISEIIQG